MPAASIRIAVSRMSAPSRAVGMGECARLLQNAAGLRFLSGLAIGHQKQDGGARNGDPARDAVMAGPSSVGVLHTQEFGPHLAVPLHPLPPARALAAVADTEIGEEFLASDRSKTGDELRVGELILDGTDFLVVDLAVLIRAAELLQLLGAFVKRN